MSTKDDGNMTSFETGATRDTSEGKLDMEGFTHPMVEKQFAKYMNMNRIQSDGELRDSDNWQKGISKETYMKSLRRHHDEAWLEWRGFPSSNGMLAALCGIIFNAKGMMLELLKSHEYMLQDFDGSQPTPEMQKRLDKIKADSQKLEVGCCIACGYPEDLGCRCDLPIEKTNLELAYDDAAEQVFANAKQTTYEPSEEFLSLKAACEEDDIEGTCDLDPEARCTCDCPSYARCFGDPLPESDDLSLNPVTQGLTSAPVIQGDGFTMTEPFPGRHYGYCLDQFNSECGDCSCMLRCIADLSDIPTLRDMAQLILTVEGPK